MSAKRKSNRAPDASIVDVLPLAAIVCDVCGRSMMLTELTDLQVLASIRLLEFLWGRGSEMQDKVFLYPPCGCKYQSFDRKVVSQSRTQSLQSMMTRYVANMPSMFPDEKLPDILNEACSRMVIQERKKLQEIASLTEKNESLDPILPYYPKYEVKRAKTVPR